VDVDLARQQWDEGRRRVEQSGSDPARFDRLSSQVDLIAADLRSRLGQVFTLDELVIVYDDAVEWARDRLHDALPENAPPPDTATVVDAAFYVFARGATDYAP
jgi:hypothetical protein